jgi:uncharacterized protein (TIGR02145 family)
MLSPLTFFCQNTGRGLTDIDGNKYKSVIIGKQEWMARNLRVTRFTNGDTIPFFKNSENWCNLDSCGFFISNNPKQTEIYGYLYNWYVVDDSRKVCPNGWHVPSDAEWTILINYLGGSNIAGRKIKQKKFFQKFFDIKQSKNYNFNAHIRGYVDFDGEYCDFGKKTSWWTATENVSNTAWNRFINLNDDNVYRDDEIKQSGLSVRCIKNRK